MHPQWCHVLITLLLLVVSAERADTANSAPPIATLTAVSKNLLVLTFGRQNHELPTCTHQTMCRRTWPVMYCEGCAVKGCAVGGCAVKCVL